MRTPPKDRSLDIFYLLRRLQQKNRFLVYDLDTDLTTVESFLLLALDTDTDVSAKTLSNLFGLDKSSISRHLSALLEKGYIASRRSNSDARAIILRLTAKGRKYAEFYDMQSELNLKEYCAGLNAAEVRRIETFFKTLNDGLGAAPQKTRKKDNPIRLEMRRMIFAFEAFKPSFMGSDLSVVQWQALSEMRLRGGTKTAADILRALGIPAGSIFALLQALEHKGYVKRSGTQSDKRYAATEVTAGGLRALSDIDSVARERIHEALRAVTRAEVNRSIEALEKFVGENGQGDIALGRSFYARRITKPEDLKELRAFFVEEAVRRKRHRDLPETLFAARSFNFALYKSTPRMMRGACEACTDGILNECSVPGVPNIIAEAFLKIVKQIAKAC